MELIGMTETTTLDVYYQKTEAFVSRRIAGEAVLVPLRPQKGGTEFIFSLNETAASAWAALDSSQPLRAVVAQIVAEYEVDEDEAAQEVLALVEELVKLGALEKVA
jgi:hypothetical protein